MKKLALLALALFAVPLLRADYLCEPGSIGENEILPFKYYVYEAHRTFWYDSYDSICYMPLILNPDHTFDTYYFRTDSVQIMGEWRIFGDTLLLYQMEQLWADSIFRQDNINRSEHHYNDMRSTMSGFNQRLVSDTSYCLNVAAFQFEGDGSSFTGIQDRYPIVGFTVSKKEASRNHPAPYLNETINWRDTLTWKPHCWNQEENMVGLIKSIDRIDNQTVRMRVEVDGLVFTIINYYCPLNDSKQ